jgi:sugar phosphate isomerase/epimerase
MKFVQAHSQGGNPLSGVKENDDFIVDATIRSIEICAMLGIKSTVAHPGFGVGLSKKDWFRLNKEFYSKFFPVMERCGVNLLCENSTRRNTGDMYFTNSGAEMRELIEYVNHPLFHGCWDTGHANCEGNQYDDIMALGKELYAIHYNDNHGDRDEHVAPFFGSLNHDEVICALRDVGFNGYFTLECSSTLMQYNQWPIKRHRFEGDTRLQEPKLFMQRGLESLMYDTAKWMLSEYGIFEE